MEYLSEILSKYVSKILRYEETKGRTEVTRDEGKKE